MKGSIFREGTSGENMRLATAAASFLGFRIAQRLSFCSIIPSAPAQGQVQQVEEYHGRAVGYCGLYRSVASGW
jgi:hypothetical protein